MEAFKDSNKISAADLIPTDCKVQITAVDPFRPTSSSATNFTAEGDVAVDLSHYGSQNNVRLFVFDTPFTLTGKTHATADQQHKRKTVLVVAASFPYALRRLPVIQRFERILSPIECVIEDIMKRNARLEREIRPKIGPPKLKTLYQVLSGSVNMQVHGGAEEVCQLFLHPAKVEQYEASQVTSLRRVLMSFLELCKEAIEVARTLCTERDRTFQVIIIVCQFVLFFL